VLRHLDQCLAVTDQDRGRREQLLAHVGEAERRSRLSSDKGSAIPDQAAPGPSGRSTFSSSRPPSSGRESKRACSRTSGCG
jgi:hypothetical protein